MTIYIYAYIKHVHLEQIPFGESPQLTDKSKTKLSAVQGRERLPAICATHEARGPARSDARELQGHIEVHLLRLSEIEKMSAAIASTSKIGYRWI